MLKKINSSTKGLIILNCALTLIIFSLFSVIYHRHAKPTETKSVAVKNVAEQVEEKIPEPIPSDEDHEKIQKMIATILGDEAERYAVYIFRPGKDLTPIIFQSRRMKPASMIKMFVLAKAMQDIRDGKLSLDEMITLYPANIVGGAGSVSAFGAGAKLPVRLLMEHMIKESDNTATNVLIDRLGGLDVLNEYLAANNYTDTEFQHKMMLAYRGLSNYSSVKDLGELFLKIYRHQCVDDFHDKLMIEYLLKQEDTDCLPTALPLWRIAHKTGEVNFTYHDGGICYGLKSDFIIVMMNDNYSDRYNTLEKMKRIAAETANNL